MVGREDEEEDQFDDRDALEKKYEAIYKGSRPYLERERSMGCGEFRMGKSLEFRQDMYSLLFISMVKPIYKIFCEENQERDL